MTDRILAIDTSSSRSAVGVFSAAGALAIREFPDPQSQSALLLPAITSVLEDATLSLAQIAAVAVAIGPGAFTALRVGIATAKAIAEVTSLPLLGIANTEAAALAVSTQRPGPEFGLVVLPASRGEVYLAPYSHPGNARELRMMGDSEVAKLEAWPGPPAAISGVPFQVVVSPDPSLLERASKLPWGAGADTVRTPSSLLASLAELAFYRLGAGEISDPCTVDAAYVRRVDADNAWVDSPARLHASPPAK